MLIATLLLPLLCPPTTTSDSVPGAYGRTIVNAYHFGGDGPIDWAALPPLMHDVPELPTLPLWDLETTFEQVRDGDQPDDVIWLRWVIATAQRRPVTAQHWLVEALASDELTAARLVWWRSLGVHDRHAQDALLEAYANATDTRTQLYLVAVLALGEWAFSCPVTVALDGACRMPGAAMGGLEQILVRREPIAVERARYWTKRAGSLRRKAAIDPTDVAEVALLAELDLAAMSEDYESQLVAQMPADLDFRVEDYLEGFGVSAWDRRVEHQRAYQKESRRRFVSFLQSRDQCWDELHDRHGELARTHADLAARILLREATLLLAGADDLEREDVRDRNFARIKAERRPNWNHDHIDESLEIRLGHAIELLSLCADPTFTANPELVEACRSAYWDPEPLVEFVPQSAATSRMQRYGLVPSPD